MVTTCARRLDDDLSNSNVIVKGESKELKCCTGRSREACTILDTTNAIREERRGERPSWREEVQRSASTPGYP
jgi:hypothetical protein